MTWEEKFRALRALDPTVCLMMRDDGIWFVPAGRRAIGQPGAFTCVQESGLTPEEAVNEIWDRYMSEALGESALLLDPFSDTPRKVRWNGFMWQDVP